MCHRTSVTLPHPPARSALRRAGFTLIEILVVMGIIVLLIALALPAFNFMTGARSIEASSNQLAAALGIARADAIGIQDDRGVVVYHNAASGRDEVAEVELKSYPFNAFTEGTAANPVTYQIGQYVSTNNGAKSFVCLQTYVDTSSDPNAPGSDIAHWREMKSATAFSGTTGTKILDFKSGREYMTLPVGISVRGAGNTVNFQYKSTATPTYNGTNYTIRYFSPAVCMFNANGQVVCENYHILPEGLLGDRMGSRLNPTYDLTALGDDPIAPAAIADDTCPYGWTATGSKSLNIQSQLGFVFYDTEIFKNVAAGFTPAGQDAWLDQNATPVMVNRYNGTLVKGE